MLGDNGSAHFGARPGATAAARLRGPCPAVPRAPARSRPAAGAKGTVAAAAGTGSVGAAALGWAAAVVPETVAAAMACLCGAHDYTMSLAGMQSICSMHADCTLACDTVLTLGELPRKQLFRVQQAERPTGRRGHARDGVVHAVRGRWDGLRRSAWRGPAQLDAAAVPGWPVGRSPVERNRRITHVDGLKLECCSCLVMARQRRHRRSAQSSCHAC